MVVCFSVGHSSEVIAEKMKRVMDNVDFHVYSDVQELIKDANLRHLAFKRVIISDSIIKDSERDLTELSNFIKGYSSNTEVVFLLNPKPKENSEESEEVFNRLFNSPLYTPVKPKKISMRLVEELIQGEIVELDVKYYGQSKNSTKSQDSSPVTVNVNKGEESDTRVQSINGEETGESSGSLNSSNTSNQGTNEVAYSNNEGENISSSESERVSEGVGDDRFANFYDDDDELSLGDFGSMHSDTGFLDEEEEQNDAELQEFKKSQEIKQKVEEKEVTKEIPISKPLPKPVVENNTPKTVEERPVEKPIERSEESPREDRWERQGISSTNIDIQLSLRSANTTQDMVDSAVKIVSENNSSILLIDADSRENRLLSFIDIERYYQRDCTKGISKQKVYTEDGVGIISNGYGYKITSADICSLLKSDLIRSYDMVYIDCPIDCLKSLSMEVLKSCNIILNPGHTFTDYISTSYILSSREYTSLEQEKLIYSKCLLDMENYSLEDIKLLKEICLFANGSWLDRIGL